MPPVASRVSEHPIAFDTLPVCFNLRTGWGIGAAGLLLVGTLVCLAVCFFAVPAGDPLSALDLASADPGAALQSATGLGFLLVLIAVPITRSARRWFSVQRVEIEHDAVRMIGRGLLGPRIRIEPLRNYRGVTRCMRTTLSGTHEELILVHPRRRQSVLLHASRGISDATLEQAAKILQLPIIPCADLYRMRWLDVTSPFGLDVSLPSLRTP
jgi:hypothetical protein